VAVVDPARVGSVDHSTVVSTLSMLFGVFGASAVHVDVLLAAAKTDTAISWIEPV